MTCFSCEVCCNWTNYVCCYSCQERYVSPPCNDGKGNECCCGACKGCTCCCDAANASNVHYSLNASLDPGPVVSSTAPSRQRMDQDLRDSREKV